MDRLDISYNRTFQGAWELPAIVNGYRVSQQYMGYTKREAEREFRAYVKGLDRTGR